MAAQLDIYNAALAEFGARELTSLTDNVESRRVLDRLWNNGLINRCLEQGEWNFATRTVKLTNDPVNASFGLQYRFDKPTDWIRTHRVAMDGTFNTLLDNYVDEGQYWYAGFSTIYIQYISSDPDFGNNLALWPESFTRYVSLTLATLAVPRLLPLNEALRVLQGPQGLYLRSEQALRSAKSKDASNQPPEFFPMGTWARSRSVDRFNIQTNKNND